MMSDTLPATAQAPSWEPVELKEPDVAVAQKAVFGTTARVVVWPPRELGRALAAVDGALVDLDIQASRFREDSEISRLNRSTGHVFFLSDGFAEVMAAALAAAQWTDGLVDPTVGQALMSWGYDRDFATIQPLAELPTTSAAPAPGWDSVQLEGRLLRRPPGTVLDLGATAKGLGSDRAARSAFRAIGRAGGVLVSLGGDVAVAGQSPDGGWPIRVAEDPASPENLPTQVVRLRSGALATSSVTCRRWKRGGRDVHHIIDPRTGVPASGPWRTATVAAPTCASANAASTALIVGGEDAARWLTTTGLPARLVEHDGSVRLVGPWPQHDEGLVDTPMRDALSVRIGAMRGVA
jgi:thiamine biosynthesis lipoprotein